MTTKIKTSAGIEFREGELLELAQENKLVVKYRTIYAARYSLNGGECLEKVYRYQGDLPLTKRGRFHVMTPTQVNSLLGFDLFHA